jgi:hypothetical protein
MIENKLLTESKEPALGAGGLEFKSPRPDHSLLIFQFTLVERVAPEPELGSIVIQTRSIQTQAVRYA